METLDLTNTQIAESFCVFNHVTRLQPLKFEGMEHEKKHRCPNCGATKVVNDNCKYCGT